MDETIAMIIAAASIIPAIESTRLLINSEADYQETSSLLSELFPLGLFIMTWVAFTASVMRIWKHFIDVNDTPQVSQIVWSFAVAFGGLVAFEAITKLYKRTNSEL